MRKLSVEFSLKSNTNFDTLEIVLDRREGSVVKNVYCFDRGHKISVLPLMMMCCCGSMESNPLLSPLCAAALTHIHTQTHLHTSFSK